MNPIFFALGSLGAVAALAFVAFRVYIVRCSETQAVDANADGMRVIIPAIRGRLPAVFFAHNGEQTKEDWGDFPEEIAREGYAVVNMGWTDFNGSDDLKKEIDIACMRWKSRIDPRRAAFIGGCHGGVKLLSVLESKIPVRVQALVLLSLSELYPAPSGHAPILGIYSLKDHLGEGYITTQKEVYESTLSDPKKVLALVATPHGHELVTDSSTRKRVRSEVVTWLKKYL